MTASGHLLRYRLCVQDRHEPVDLQKVSELGVALNNAAIEGKPDDLVINTHVCRGNYHSTYAFEGGYDPIAPYLFANEDVDAFYLEFDTPRAGGFEPLRYVAPGKKVVLGLVTTKAAELEDEDAIVERIHEAAKYVPLENLYLSPQCGFASCEDWQQADRGRAMGKDRAGQAYCRARLEIAVTFAGDGACETWRIAYNGSDRIVRAGNPLCSSALPF